MNNALQTNSVASHMLGTGMSIRRHLTDGEFDQAGKELDTVSKLDMVARTLKANVHQLNTVIQYQFWILRDMGEYLNEHAPHGGLRPSKWTVRDLGISSRLAKRCRAYAAIHTQDAKTYFDDWDETRGELSLAYLLRLQTESVTEPKPAAIEAAEIFVKIGNLCDNGIGLLGISERDRQRLKMIKGIVKDD